MGVGFRTKDSGIAENERPPRLEPRTAVKSGKQKHIGDRTENPLPEKDRSQKPLD